jgi:hypothetical protein
LALNSPWQIPPFHGEAEPIGKAVDDEVFITIPCQRAFHQTLVGSMISGLPSTVPLA